MKEESKLSILLYILGIISCLIFIINSSLFFIITSVFLLVLSIFLQKNKNKFTIYTLLIIFFIGLGYFILFEPLLRRHGIFQDFSFNHFLKNLTNNSNIIPFKTIWYYLYNIFNYKSAYKLSLDTYGLFLNFFGNLLCLTPLAILLPLCSDKYKKTKKYISTILLIAIIIEFVQIITSNGILDIDDIILNAGGAIFVFFIVNPSIINLIESILLKKSHKLNVLQIIIRTAIIILCAIAFIVGYNYRKKIELDYVEYISNYDITIKYKNDKCDNKVKDYFYEDEMYKYYLTCHSKEDTTIYINNKSYSVNEVFNGKTEYKIQLYKFIDKGLNVEKEEKHKRLEICGILGNKVSFSYNATDILYFEYINTEKKNNETCTNIFMIPQKDGTAQAIFYIEKHGIESKKVTYEFTVKNNQVISYELIENSK